MNRVYEVDITCPKDILIPFLMHRIPHTKSNGEIDDSKKIWEGKSTQNLLPKKKEWYTGPELWEATKLGYKITNIHSYIEWDRAEPIFHDFIIKANEQKTNSARDSPAYQTAKNSMNGVTGKFGQKKIDQSKAHITLEEMAAIRLDPSKHPLGKRLGQIRTIRNEQNKVVSYLVDIYNQDTNDSPFPIHLSSFILAESKVFMSKLIRRMNIQKDPILTPIYSDTDSYIMHHNGFDRLNQKYVGKLLGQLKKEIDGKILGIVVIAPKTYQIIYVAEEDRKIYCMMRCKGIPHISNEFPYHSDHTIPMDDKEFTRDEIIQKFKHIYNRKSRDPCPNVIMKQFYYMEIPIEKSLVKNEDRDDAWFEGIQFYKRIHFEIAFRMISGKTKVECLYPQFIRSTHGAMIDDIQVTPDWSVRSVFNNLWWSSPDCNRIYPSFTDKHDYYQTAYPIGHQVFENASIENLIDLMDE